MQKNKNPESVIGAGNVSSQASDKFRTVAHCNPECLATIIPATPEDNTRVVLTVSASTAALPR